jgi:hypothetical protein
MFAKKAKKSHRETPKTPRFTDKRFFSASLGDFGEIWWKAFPVWLRLVRAGQVALYFAASAMLVDQIEVIGVD